MNKSGLVAEVAKRTESGKAEVGRVIDAAIAVIRESVARGERVALVGFGSFEKRRRNQRVARNPRKPEVPIPVPARDVPSFTPGQEFRNAVTARPRRSSGRQPGRSSGRKAVPVSTKASRGSTAKRSGGARKK